VIFRRAIFQLKPIRFCIGELFGVGRYFVAQAAGQKSVA
jgi:hypothetical protein